MRSGVFIGGTGTEIGKTLISALIMIAATNSDIAIRYYKPIQTGEDSDCDTVKKLADLKEEIIVRPSYFARPPMAAYRAARLEKRPIDIEKIMQDWEKLYPFCCVVEGGGGLLNPIRKNYYMRELNKALNIPLIIVASTILGTINHTMLTIETAKNVGIPINGIILSGPEDTGLAEVLEELSAVPVLAEIPQLKSVSPKELIPLAKAKFNSEVLQKIFRR